MLGFTVDGLPAQRRAHIRSHTSWAFWRKVIGLKTASVWMAGGTRSSHHKHRGRMATQEEQRCNSIRCSERCETPGPPTESLYHTTAPPRQILGWCNFNWYLHVTWALSFKHPSKCCDWEVPGFMYLLLMYSPRCVSCYLWSVKGLKLWFCSGNSSQIVAEFVWNILPLAWHSNTETGTHLPLGIDIVPTLLGHINVRIKLKLRKK